MSEKPHEQARRLVKEGLRQMEETGKLHILVHYNLMMAIDEAFGDLDSQKALGATLGKPEVTVN